MWLRATLLRTDVPVERITSIIRPKTINDLRSTLAVTNNWSSQRIFCVSFRCCPIGSIIWPENGTLWPYTELFGLTTQKFCPLRAHRRENVTVKTVAHGGNLQRRDVTNKTGTSLFTHSGLLWENAKKWTFVWRHWRVCGLQAPLHCVECSLYSVHAKTSWVFRYIRAQRENYPPEATIRLLIIFLPPGGGE
jgi:hypothetical protein